MLGARGLQMFWRVTLPNIKWGLLYGVILCNARAMGEFGAVSVVSGHIRGQTNTLPLHVEILYNEYNFQAAFAVASLLALLALVTLRAEDGGRVAQRRRRRRRRLLEAAMSIEVRGVTKTFGTFVALRRRRACTCPRRAGGAARPVRLGQDDAAAHHRGAGARRPRHGALRRRGRHRRERARPRRRLRLPALRALPPHDGVRERRLRPARAAAPRAPVDEAEIRKRVSELLKLVQLDWLARPLSRRSSPAASGSASRSRARSRSSRKVLLLDEPFGALDAKVRQELRRWLRRLHDEIHVTSVFVTHDQEEALEVADRVVVMNQGRIEQVGTPEEVFEQPGDAVRDGLPRQREHLPRPRRGGPRAPRPARGRLPRARRGDRAHSRRATRARTSWSSAREEADGGFWATLRHVNPAGAVIKLELDDDEGRLVQVESTRWPTKSCTRRSASGSDATAPGAHFCRTPRPQGSRGLRGAENRQKSRPACVLRRVVVTIGP